MTQSAPCTTRKANQLAGLSRSQPPLAAGGQYRWRIREPHVPFAKAPTLAPEQAVIRAVQLAAQTATSAASAALPLDAHGAGLG